MTTDSPSDKEASFDNTTEYFEPLDSSEEHQDFLGGSEYVDEVMTTILGHPRSLNRFQVASQVGASGLETREIWRALGFPNARDGDVVFTQGDVAAFRQMREIAERLDLDAETTLAIARAYGRGTDRLSMWHAQLVAEMEANEARNSGDVSPPDTTRAIVEKIVETMSDMEPLLVYCWRRAMGQAVTRLVADSQPNTSAGVRRTVGFADLVSYTGLVRSMSERDLARLVSRFERMASDIISSHAGALVKTVGDEVLFTHPRASAAARIALDLADAALADDLVPRMRVGLATGKVLARLGDVFGHTVNQAARLTTVAQAGHILVDDSTARLLEHRSEFELTKWSVVDLSGIGHVVPYDLQRADMSSSGDLAT